MKGIVITPGGDISVQDFHTPLYQTVGAAVGGYIEHVKPMRLPEPYCMIVNEDGCILRLPINPVGCALYRTDIHGFPILGTIVIMQDGFANGEHDIVGIPDSEIPRLVKQFKQAYGLNMKEDN